MLNRHEEMHASPHHCFGAATASPSSATAQAAQLLEFHNELRGLVRQGHWEEGLQLLQEWVHAMRHQQHGYYPALRMKALSCTDPQSRPTMEFCFVLLALFCIACVLPLEVTATSVAN